MTVVGPLCDCCVTVVGPLCDHCVTLAGPSLNRSISAVGLYKRDVRRYTIIMCAAAVLHIRGTAVLVPTVVVCGLSSPSPTRHMQA